MCRSLFLIVLVLGLANSAFGVTVTKWTGNIDTDWATTGNWSNGLPFPSTDSEPRIGGYASGNDPCITGTGNESGTVYIGTSDGDGELTLAVGAELYLTPGRDLMVGSTIRVRDDKSDWYRITAMRYTDDPKRWIFRLGRPYANPLRIR